MTPIRTQLFAYYSSAVNSGTTAVVVSDDDKSVAASDIASPNERYLHALMRRLSDQSFDL
jgi:hypothetical protein